MAGSQCSQCCLGVLFTFPSRESKMIHILDMYCLFLLILFLNLTRVVMRKLEKGKLCITS